MTDIDPQAVTFVRDSKPNESKFFKTAQDRLRVQSGEAQAFVKFRVSIPARRELVSATLTARGEEALSGAFDARSVASGGVYQQMSWGTRPEPIAGSADRIGSVGGGQNRALSFPVTADVATALASNAERVAFRLSAGSTTSQWLVTASLTLTLVTRPISVDPTDLAPSGLVGTAKPTFTWTAPKGITKTRLQVSTTSAFSSTVYDSGELNATTPEVDTATGPVWAGLSGTMYVRVQHFTGAGWSAWQTVTVTYLAPINFVVSNPDGSDADPTPPSVWSPAAQAVEIVSYLDGRRIGSTGIVPGPLSTLTPVRGAQKAGQVLKRVHQFYDGQPRTEPAFVERVTETTFAPTGVVAGLTGITATQAGELPAVDVHWTRGDVPDEVGLYHGDLLTEIVPGTGPAVDWTVPPNTDVIYGGRAVVNGEHSSTMQTQSLRTVVTGAWLVDPITGRGCVLAGLGIEVGYGDVSVVHTPIDGAVLLRRTLVLRGPEGSVAGQIDDWPGRTKAEQKADVEWLRERPERVLRLIMGDLNVPVVCSSLQAVFDVETSFFDRVRHNVSFTFSHAGDD